MYHYANSVALLSAFILTYWVDRRTHRQNIDILRDCGGEEIAKTLSHSYYRLIPWFFLAALTESIFLSWEFPRYVQVAGGILLVTGLVVRFWSMYSLGQLWSMGIIYVAGVDKVCEGPYRWFHHPEYNARFLEGLGFVLLLQAPFAGSIFLPIMALAAYRLAKIERRQMEELCRQPLADFN